MVLELKIQAPILGNKFFSVAAISECFWLWFQKDFVHSKLKTIV